MKLPCTSSLPALLLSGLVLVTPHNASAQAAPASPAYTPPAQIQPSPPSGSQPTRNFDIPIGAFQGQSDIGSTHLPGGALYDGTTKEYTVSSAGYNTVFVRDEFRFLWSKMSGDVSLAADIAFPDPDGYEGRKAVLVIRQSLDDDSKEAVAALYGNGSFRFGQRPRKGVRRLDMEYRVWSREGSGNPPARVSSVLMPQRIGLGKYGDVFILYVSMHGEPMHPFGEPLILHMNGPFYVGIGFCSNLKDKSDVAIFRNVILEAPSISAH
jgi:hypothetical protein